MTQIDLMPKAGPEGPQAELVKQGPIAAKRPTRVTWGIGRSTKDREGEVLRPIGWHAANPLPVVQLFHDSKRFPVGAIEKFTPSDELPLIDVVFNDDVEDFTDARIAADLVRLTREDGTPRWPTGSVGFEPEEWINADGTATRREKGDPWPYPEAGREYIRQELLEQSLVPVPSNITNLVQAVKAFAGEFPKTAARKFNSNPLEEWEEQAIADFIKALAATDWQVRLGLKFAEALDEERAVSTMDAAHRIAAVLRQLNESAKRAE